jgi:hypothetical protein
MTLAVASIQKVLDKLEKSDLKERIVLQRFRSGPSLYLNFAHN